MTPEASRRPGLTAVLLLVVLASVAFLLPKQLSKPQLIGVVDDPLVLGVVYDGGRAAPTTAAPLTTGPIPVIEFSFAVDRWLAGGRSASMTMHRHSVLAHLLASVVLLFLLARLGVGRTGAVAGAVVFLLHPAGLETVSIVGFRPAILAGLFVFLSLAAVARGVATRRRIHALPAIGFAVLAAASSPVALLLPGLAYLVGWRVAGRGVVPAVGLALPTGLVAWLHGWFAEISVQVDKMSEPLVALLVPPVPAWLAEPWLPATPASVLGVAGVGGLLSVAFVVRRRWPTLTVGLGFTALAALAAGLAGGPAAGTPNAAGYLVVAGAAMAFAALRMADRTRWVVAGLAAVSMLVVDWRRDGIYRTSETLFAAAKGVPLADALLAERLARSSDGATQRRALALWAVALPRLAAGATWRRLQMALVRTLAKQGQRGAATQAAERLSRAAETDGGVEAQVEAYLLTLACFAVENIESKVAEYLDKAKALAPDHPEVLAAVGERQFLALARVLGAMHGRVRAAAWLPRDDARGLAIEALVDRALRVDSACGRAHLLAGQLMEARGDLLDAWSHFDTAKGLLPDLSQPRLLLARLDLKIGRVDDADVVVRTALAEGIDDEVMHYLLVRILWQRGRLADARQYLEVYLENHGGSPGGRNLLANLLSAQAFQDENELPPAELAELARRIEELNPDDAKGLLIRATVVLRRRPERRANYRDAIVLIESAQLKMPADPEVLRRLANAHKSYGWWLKLKGKARAEAGEQAAIEALAMDQFRRFLALAPPTASTEAVRLVYHNHCEKLRQAGVDHLRQGEPWSAAVKLQRLAELLPEHPEPQFVLGLARRDQDQLQAAVGCFEKAIALGRVGKVDVSVYMLGLLETLQLAGRPTEARRRAEDFLQHPGAADAGVLAKIRARLRD